MKRVRMQVSEVKISQGVKKRHVKKNRMRVLEFKISHSAKKDMYKKA